MWILALVGCDADSTAEVEAEAPESKLFLSPSTLTFGTESASDVLTIRSIGELPVDLESVWIEGSAAFSLTDPGAGTLEPGSEVDVVVTFAATGVEESASVIVASNAEYAPHSMTLRGGIVGPVAVCDVSPGTIAPLDGATWEASASYDPDGRALISYEWTVVDRPAGSEARFASGTDVTFVPDLAGTYVAELVVTNDAGVRSEPCTATLDVTPTDQLWIEMYWSQSGDDMDLHLLAPEGELVTNGDCYYGTCTYGRLDWGVRGDDTDDPVMDLDDIPGTGPEAITLPVPGAGEFIVYVHDYPGSVYIGRNDVTLNVYVHGVLAWTETRDVDEEDLYEPFVAITFPEGGVAGL